MKNKKQNFNQQISTKLGTIVLIIITLTVGVFVWKIGKDQEAAEQSQSVAIQPKTQQQGQTENTNTGITIAEPVKNWKICHNIKGAYDMKYPSDWVFGMRGPFGYEQLKNCSSSLMIFSAYINSSGTGPSSIRIDANDQNQKGGSNFKRSDSLDEYLQINFDLPSIKKETTLKGERAVYVENFPNLRVLAYHHDIVFDISGTNISEQTFNDFLFTFKFLK